MSLLYNPYSGDMYPGFVFDVSKLVAAYFVLSTTPPLLYAQSTLESYIVDNDGNFITFG